MDFIIRISMFGALIAAFSITPAQAQEKEEILKFSAEEVKELIISAEYASTETAQAANTEAASEEICGYEAPPLN